MTRARMPRSGVSEIQALRPTGTTQTISASGSSAAISNAVGVNVVRIFSDVAGFIAIGSAPTATTSDMPITANVAEYFKVTDGTDKVAIITAGGTGTCYVSEMN